MKTKLNLSLLTSVLLTLSGGVLADQYHYSDILIGDRAAGFAGAYTAISDDPSGLYYNPAGIVRAPDGQLSASANAFNQTSYKYSNINEGGHTWERKSSSSMANFFGAFQPMGDVMVGFSIAVPDSTKASHDETFRNYPGAGADLTIVDDVINYKEDDSTTLFGPSIAWNIREGLSIGGTLYVHYRNAEFIFLQKVKAEIKSTGQIVRENITQIFKTSELGIKPMFGIMWDASSNVSIGATLAKTFLLNQSPMAQLNRFYDYDKTTDSNGDVTYAYTGPSINRSNEYYVGMKEATDRHLPFEAKLGVAWFASPKLILASDIQYYDETKDYASVLNMSAGMEYYFSPQLSTRWGVNTNNSNNKTLEQEGFDVDMLGMSWSVSQHNRLSALTLGFNYSQGSGKARLNADSNRIQDLTIQSLTAYIATSMNF